jgi:hypothetical protein
VFDGKFAGVLPYRYTPLPPSTPFANAVNGPFVTPDAKKPEFTEYRATGAKYDATYVVFACTAIGDANVACCQPVADSPVNVTDPNNVPVDVHKLPTCVPEFPAPL